MESLEDLITLNLTEGIGIVLYRRLVNSFGSAAGAARASRESLSRVHGIGEKRATAITENFRKGAATRELERADELGVRIIPWYSEDYPKPLKTLYDAPLVLYVKGQLLHRDLLSVAVIGTRRCSHYGRSMAGRFSRELATRGFTVTSGLARGIDTVAHAAALDVGGRTVAVLGSGLDHIYPKENHELFDRISERGACLSELCLRASPEAKNFPRRNRIVSGLSLGVLVVECPLKSGAMITVDWALQQGKEVFAIPGKIDTPNSRGCHQLIRQGAHLVESLEDLLEQLSPWMGLVQSRKHQNGNAQVVTPTAALTPEEGTLFDCLDSDPRAIDDLARETGLPVQKVSSLLLMMELKKLVRQLPGKVYVRV